MFYLLFIYIDFPLDCVCYPLFWLQPTENTYFKANDMQLQQTVQR